MSTRLGNGLVLLLLAATTSLCGCVGIQSTLAPRGPASVAIANISWIMFAGATAILILVMALAFYAIYRRPEQRKMASANGIIIIGGVLFPVVTLTALLIYGVIEMRKSTDAPDKAVPAIEVVGHQWWWEVHYRDETEGIISANEIHIPAGKPVTISLRSHDVIHSFWVPNLAGKMDLIPGRQNHITLHADQPGIFRGQCAEFCGAQHARMALHVIAHAPADYAAWLQRQRARPGEYTDPAILRGRNAFIANNCIACHAVDGTGGKTRPGPELSHVASRQYLAAGSLQYSRDNLIHLIADIQRIKPGSAMPAYPRLQQETLQDLATYLESLH